MGSFNISGFYSHLPIRCGDRIGAILCAKQDVRQNLAMYPIGLGFYPMMAPVYGEYNDYGGMENITETFTTRIFKQLTGKDFTEFIDMHHRNSTVSMNTKDNGNQFDDIPGYQAVLKYLIPEHVTIFDVSKIENELRKYEAENNEEVAEQYRNILESDKAEIEALSKATFAVIYEHESVLKQLAKTGNFFMNCTWYGRKYDTSADYDELAKYADKFDGSIFNKLKLQEKIIDAMKKFIDDNTDKIKSGELNDKVKDFQNYNVYKFNLFEDWMEHEDFFCALYKNADINYSELKNDFLDLIYINKGLLYMHGVYCPSAYSGQDIYTRPFTEMIGTYNVIMNNLKDYDEEKFIEID